MKIHTSKEERDLLTSRVNSMSSKTRLKVYITKEELDVLAQLDADLEAFSTRQGAVMYLDATTLEMIQKLIGDQP